MFPDSQVDTFRAISCFTVTVPFKAKSCFHISSEGQNENWPESVLVEVESL